MMQVGWYFRRTWGEDERKIGRLVDLPRSTGLLSGPSHAQNLVQCEVFGEPYAQNLVKYEASGAPQSRKPRKIRGFGRALCTKPRKIQCFWGSQCRKPCKIRGKIGAWRLPDRRAPLGVRVKVEFWGPTQLQSTDCS